MWSYSNCSLYRNMTTAHRSSSTSRTISTVNDLKIIIWSYLRSYLRSYLKIKIKNLNIEEQYNTLKHYKLLPLNIRLFQNLVFFIFSLVQGNRTSTLLKSINSLKKIRVTRTHFFEEPTYKTILYKYSFISISIRLLNAFIFKSLNIEKNLFRSAFEASSLQLYNAHKKTLDLAYIFLFLFLIILSLGPLLVYCFCLCLLAYCWLWLFLFFKFI